MIDMTTKFKLILSIALLAFVQLVGAQTKDTILLWSEGNPTVMDLNPSERTGWYEGIFEVNTPLLKAYFPEKKFDRKISCVVCPGGGFTHLSIKKEGYEIAEWLNSLGITAFVLQYSVPNKKTQAISDIQRAVRLVRHKTEEWGLNPNKVGVIGFSAGGNLGARISCDPEKSNYPAKDSIDALSFTPDFVMLIYPGGLVREADNGLPPHLSFGENSPPMFLFGTQDDNITNHGLLNLTMELYHSMVPVELHILPEGGHGYGLRMGNSAGQVWPALAQKWLHKYVYN